MSRKQPTNPTSRPATSHLSRRDFLRIAAAGTAGLAMPAIAQEAWQPTRPVRLVVPYPPGGITDFQGRLIAQRLAERLKQPVVVENRAGASGAIGTESAARSAGDGYTMVLGTQGTIFINPFLYPAQKQVAEMLVPVHGIASTPVTLVCNASRPYRTLEEMLAYARKNPGKINVGSPGAGTGAYMAFLQMQGLTAIQTTHVPYKGSGAALNDLIAGVVDVMPDYMVAVQPHVRDGRLRALAVSSTERLTIAPDVPTFAEAGVPGGDLVTWTGLFAPATTPRNALVRLSDEIGAVLREVSVDESLRKGGSVPMGTFGVDKFAAFVTKEGPRWQRLATQAGLQPG